MIFILKSIIFDSNLIILAMLIFGGSIVLTFLAIPKLIRIIKYINLLDPPNERSSHIHFTPNLGGVVFYFCLMVSFFFIHYFDVNDISFNIIVGLTILFFTGIKDDIMILSPKTKLFAQFVAISFLMLNPEMYVHNFHSVFGFSDLPIFVSMLFGYFLIIFLINAYNLIDGIDALASMLGILIFSIFGLIFYFTELYFYFLLSVVILGFLIGFLRFNLSKKLKIFMGDTGSMIVGYLIGIMTLRFLAMDEMELQQVHVLPENKIPIVLSILFFPIIDVIRVIIIRIKRKKQIFSADRSHMHHILIDKGLSHKMASILLTISSCLIFLISYFLNIYLPKYLLITMFGFLILITFYYLWLMDKTSFARKTRKQVKAYIPKKLYFFEFRIRKSIILFFKSKIL